jgi:hypothetical protein
MNIFIRNSRTLLVAAAMVLGVTATTGGAYAQQPADKAKAADKSTSTDKKKPSSLSGKKDGEMIVEVPVIVMVPMQVSNDLVMDKGCWVKL